ncbi:MAG: MAPEG family protein [Pseudomonadota bacterium]
MTTVITCLLIMAILPLLCSWISGYYRQSQLGTIDNKEPRVQSQALTGAGTRAVAAQANSWEALGVFTAALLAVYASGVPFADITTQAVVFTLLRIAYIPAYIGNLDKLRSLIYIAGLGICIYLFIIAIRAH